MATTVDLLNVMPQIAELPPGWASQGGLPIDQLDPQTGPYFGICGGDSLDARAIQNGVVAYMSASDYTTPEHGRGSVTLYAFPSPDAAAAFLAQRRVDAASCPNGLEYQVAEGSGSGQYDGFSTDSGPYARATWTGNSRVTQGAALAASTDEAFFTNMDTDYTTRVQGFDFGIRETALAQYERHDRVVVMISLFGTCCAYGFSNVGGFNEYTPTFDQLTAASDALRPALVAKLRAAQLIP